MKNNIIENCLDCKHHKIINDPDPHDFFNIDDVALVCTLTNVGLNPNSEYFSDRGPYKCVVFSCRPHRVRLESNIPLWCPLKKQK